MILRNSAWRKAGAVAEAILPRSYTRSKGTASSAPATEKAHTSSPKHEQPVDLRTHYASISKREEQNRSREREFLVSVLESSSATKRDAKQYLQTFAPTLKKTEPWGSSKTTSSSQSRVLNDGILSASESPKFIQGPDTADQTAPAALPHVAIIKFREPESADDVTIEGLAKTLVQLRTLGLLSIVVVDCSFRPASHPHWHDLTNQQINRLIGAIDSFGEPFTRIVDDALSAERQYSKGDPGFTSNGILIEDGKRLLPALRRGAVVIVPSYVTSAETQTLTLVNADDIVVSLTRYLSGLQFQHGAPSDDPESSKACQPQKTALVDRVIVLDPLGGIPAKYRGNSSHVFLNLEDEFPSAKAHLETLELKTGSAKDGMSEQETIGFIRQKHIENLNLARTTLAILPPTSSALLTTPAEAANLASRASDKGFDGRITGFVGTVGTRRSHNPLIHNLLTDRPSYSASLPLTRIKPIKPSSGHTGTLTSTTTLAKKGMPVTIFPDPRVSPWVPPKPGGPRLRLTDTCVDLPRLVHLIDDSFNRKLDVQHYLERVKDSLAGIIIAGEYEGGAILTWERPFGLDEETAYNTGRLVPYLDKFAVLKRSQGAGGVADIVFNAMVRDCFPEGVCWRSRKNNPVNKWYFERSRGSWKLDGTEWAMFWTTPSLASAGQKVWDYENVCRNILPSWADKKHIVD
ncbi:hypothetical protein NKR23_g8216 [Pleurostoma richardsiae]|uniref:Amino-acid acetyltransferase, mitochondrial n=1 Tax=Pleurostoma richardsiae TaxID=41990 RepID=A0AA38VLP9_9PEZI|nr:hypothetical protein NKR23_g8216 [Pleurostoma richardsiae]